MESGGFAGVTDHLLGQRLVVAHRVLKFSAPAFGQPCYARGGVFSELCVLDSLEREACGLR